MTSKKILLVDGGVAARSGLAADLRGAGYEVTEAGSAAETQSLLQGGKFDLVLANTNLEHVDTGFSLAFHLKKDYPTLPVILMTDANQQEGLNFTLNSTSERAWIKADVLLDKPFRLEQLLYEIGRLTA